ncbi:TPA: hypothetical protein U2B00_002132 [Streptococcus suis]|nr:hypothetical protein [Streptococcus suis]HEM5945432.1 hypothetical protein [Streptococcus suis]
MNKDIANDLNAAIYDSLITYLKSIILTEVNKCNKLTWRELVVKKNSLNYKLITIIAYLYLDFKGITWKFKDENINEIYSDNYTVGIYEILKKFNGNKQILDLSYVYQRLLEIDLVYGEDNRYHFVEDKHHRDNLGSYYTPLPLAKMLTKNLLSNFIKINFDKDINNIKNDPSVIALLRNIKVIDLSVGSGIFLLSYISVIKEYISSDEDFIRDVYKSLYGTDVDPVALILSEYSISLYEGNGNLGIHLILGNPLFSSSSTFEERYSLAQESRYNNTEMGVLEELLATKGFDIVLGNPPWEKLRFEERKFFKVFSPQISQISNKIKRGVKVKELQNNNPEDYSYYYDITSDYSSAKQKIKKDNIFNCSANGELNTYSLFYELSLILLKRNGVVGLLVKSSMVKTGTNSKLFRELLNNKYLCSVDIFLNKEKIFKIDSREEFAFVVSAKSKNNNFFVKSGIKTLDTYESIKSVELNKTILKSINPNSWMIPNNTNFEELNFLINMYKNFRTFEDVFDEAVFGRLVHLTNHSEYIYEAKQDGIPIYEGKFIERYDSMYSTFKGMSQDEKYKSKASSIVQKNVKEIPESRFFIDSQFWEKISKNYQNRYTLMWRSLTSVSNRRTMLATVLPFSPTSQSIQFLQAKNNKETIILLSIFNSIIFDYLIRLKMPGIDLTQSVIKDIPVPEFENFQEVIIFENQKGTIFQHIQSRVYWLYEEDNRMRELFDDDRYRYSNNSRKICEIEIDKLIAKAYSMNEKELKKVASNFSAYYSKKEIDLFF